jgi:hypothetical protein
MRATRVFQVMMLAPALCWGQSEGGLSARALFYREQPDQDKLPPVASARPAAVAKPPAAPPKTKTPVAKAPPHTPAPGVPVIPVVQNLGLRYNVLLIDPASGKATATDPDRNFRRGECLALEFESNRSGYLYVLSQGSSGKWQPLLPSPEMPEESNIVRARTRVRVPTSHCFQIEDPPGVERVFIVLSRNPEEMYDLNDAIRGGSKVTSPAAPATSPGPVMLAMARLDREVERFASDLRGRDLRIKKIAQPEASGEMPNSVYVVNASTGGSPSDRVTTEIRIEHK